MKKIRFNKKIIIKKNIIQNELEKAVWEDVITCFANVENLLEMNLKNVEGLDYGHVISEELYLFTIRYSNLLQCGMRIIFEDQIYEIKRINDVAFKKRYNQIIAQKI